MITFGVILHTDRQIERQTEGQDDKQIDLIRFEAVALSCINSLALALCVHLSLLGVLLTRGTVRRLLLILAPSVHLRDNFNVNF